jgi:hypothetical protein
MKLGLRAGIFGMIGLAAAAAGCSGSGGGGILNSPSGSIVLTDGVSGAVLNTSATSPYLVPTSDLAFTIDATESHFAGPYDVKIISQQNLPTAANGGYAYGFSFSEPCFVITQDATLTRESVPLIFKGSNANGQPSNYPDMGEPTPGPSGAPSSSTGNPCHSGEAEVALISDTDGHSVKFYYEELP